MSEKQRKNSAEGLIMSKYSMVSKSAGTWYPNNSRESLHSSNLALRWITGGSQYRDSADYMSIEDMLREVG